MEQFTHRPVEEPIRTGAASLAIASLGYLVVKGLQTALSKGSNALPYPPGPRREPLIGSLRSFPMDHFFQHFSKWAEEYGDIVYAPIPGMKNVILNSYEAAQELLAKRPNTTGGRQVGYLVYQLMGWHWALTFNQATARHANQRKMLRQGIGPQRVGSHDTLIESEIAKLMPELETFKGNPNTTIQHLLGRIVTKATYGEKIWAEMGENLIHWNLEAFEYLTEAFFAIWMVDIFHFLRFVPDWVPGLRYKTLSRRSTHLTTKVRYEAYKRGLELYKSGELDHSILNDLLEQFDDHEDVQDGLAVLFTASSDTTEAVLKESIRIRPFIPLGIPHVNTQDEIIQGYLIPKGTVIHQNIGYMFNNPEIWGDPEVFRPERFLEPDASEGLNPLTDIFGYGMRVCPGRYFADRVMFLLVTTIISLFKIVPLEGKEVPRTEDVEYDDKAIRQPIGFECRFVVRDEKAQQLLKTIRLSG
ncbi:cytochrome P450 [Serendipita vermifera]|nr:cytochrome P450 [Serendipita vermifera]